MQCRRCGKELGGSAHCSFCGYQNAQEGSVREMSSLERNSYNGITIDAQHSEQNYERHYDRSDFQSNFQSGFARSPRAELNQNIWGRLFGNHIVTRILVALALLMLIAFTIFIALPFALSIFACIAVWYFVNRVIRQRWR